MFFHDRVISRFSMPNYIQNSEQQQNAANITFPCFRIEFNCNAIHAMTKLTYSIIHIASPYMKTEQILTSTLIE